jgi:hypothetical protein
MKGIVMKNEIKKSMGIMKTPILSIIFLMTIFCMCSYASIQRTWKIHAQCADNVTTLTDLANLLWPKDQWDDWDVCATISRGWSDSGWQFDGDDDNDGKVVSATEAYYFYYYANGTGLNSYRLVEWNVTANWTGFSWKPDWLSYSLLAVMNGGNGRTLAHEVGHCCGLGENGPDEENKDHRIMWPYYINFS